MGIERTYTQLAQMLMPYLARFEVKRASPVLVTARDRATDEVFSAESHEELLVAIALQCDWLDLAERPTVDGHPVLVAFALEHSGVGWGWLVVDRRGRRLHGSPVHRTRDAALSSLAGVFDS